MNINITPFYCYIRREHLFAYESGHGEFERAYVFGARSVSARALTFHTMTESGAQRANVPITALVHKTDAPSIALDWLQLWDCFGNEMSVTTFEYLVNKRCQVILKDKQPYWGTYKMTFDWQNNSYSDTPQDYKNGHLIALDNGCFALQPNNRILWRDTNFITKPLTLDKIPHYKVDNQLFVCEVSDRWQSQDTDAFYYGIQPATETLSTQKNTKETQ